MFIALYYNIDIVALDDNVNRLSTLIILKYAVLFFCILLGHGNSAFETADAIYPHANLVHVVGRSRVRLSWETHYVGDVRFVCVAFRNTYNFFNNLFRNPIL